MLRIGGELFGVVDEAADQRIDPQAAFRGIAAISPGSYPTLALAEMWAFGGGSGRLSTQSEGQVRFQMLMSECVPKSK